MLYLRNRCGEIKFTISLPTTLDKYSPRKCDCNFCISKNISYISDPVGKLEIECEASVEIMKQGSNEADFITCSNCKSVIVASLQLNHQLIGALNSTLLFDSFVLQPPINVSPKLLTVKEKIERWQACWLTIKLNGHDGI